MATEEARACWVLVMDTDDDDLPYDFRKDAPADREDKPKRWPPIWPWLALLGLLAIVIGVIGGLAI